MLTESFVAVIDTMSIAVNSFGFTGFGVYEECQ